MKNNIAPKKALFWYKYNQSINQSAFIYLLAPLRGSVAITNNDIVPLKAKTNSTKN